MEQSIITPVRAIKMINQTLKIVTVKKGHRFTLTHNKRDKRTTIQFYDPYEDYIIHFEFWRRFKLPQKKGGSRGT